MNIVETMKLTPEELSKKQFSELKKHTLNILERVTQYLRNGYGTDHYFINFSFDGNEDDGNDLLEVIKRLKELKKLKT